MPTTAGIPVNAAGAVYTAGNTPNTGQTSPVAAAFRAGADGFAAAAMSQFTPPMDIPGSPPASDGRITAINWVSDQTGGVNPRSAMRGKPPALSFWQRRRIQNSEPAPQPVPVYLQSRPWDRGAGAYSPRFGVLSYNPIGAGIYAPYKLPVIAGPGGRYEFGAIWWGVQVVPTSILLNPTIPVETMDALIASSRVGGTILTTG